MTQLYSFEGAMMSLDEIEEIKKSRETVEEVQEELLDVSTEIVEKPKKKKVVVKSKKITKK